MTPALPSPTPAPGTVLGPLGLPIATAIRDVEIRPAVVLAPMEGVTDLPFRRLVRQVGGTGMTCTEFIPSSGLTQGSKVWLRMAEFDPDERPVSVQIYGRDPEVMADAARFVQDLGATICDINMGCPSKKVCARSGGSALMKDVELAVSIVAAVRAAIQIPLTVKMRSGFDPQRRNAPELAWRCQEEGAEAVTIHWRTREDKYSGQRAVDKIAQAKARLRVPVFANGDIVDADSAERMLRETGCDGVMIGRGAVKNPWCLQQIADHLAGRPVSRVTPAERRDALLAYLAEQVPRFGNERAALGRFKGISKYFIQSLPDAPGFTAKELRGRVLRSQTVDDAVRHLEHYFDELDAIGALDVPAAAGQLAAS